MGEPINAHPGTVQKDDSDKPKSEQELVAEYLAEIEHATSDDCYKTFLDEGDKAYKYYKNQGNDFKLEGGTQRVAFNVFWANVETLMPIYYARLPKLVASRRVDSNEKVSVLSCKMLENATKYSLDQEQDDFNEVINMAVKDMLVCGRGQGRVFYKAQFEEVMGEDGKPYKRVIPFTEKATTGYVFWRDYLTNRARNATEHRWRAHRSFMTRSELVGRFGAIGRDIPLETDTSMNEQEGGFKKDYVGKAAIWEMWHQATQKVCYFAPSYGEAPLQLADDTLKLDNFFPYPRPLTGTTSTDSDIPTGQFKIDKALLDEVNEVMKRIMSMRKVIRVVGMHDKQLSDSMIKMVGLQDGQTTPANFPVNKEGVMRSGLEWFPFEKASKALQDLIQYSEFLLNRLFQQDGIPDIVRGATNPNETLGAQQIKSNFTVIRTNKKQADVQRFVKDLLSMKAQIIFEPGFFSDEMVAMMCGADSYSPEEQALYPQALELLRNDKMRTFKIDIETDSTIAVDEEADKQTAIEAYTAINNSLNTTFQVMQMDPELGLAVGEMGLYVANRFRGSRDWSGAIQRWLDKKEGEIQEQERMDEAIKNGEMEPPPPPVDPVQMKAEADMQMAQMKMQLEEQKAMHSAQLDEAVASHKASIEQMKTMSDIQMKQARLDADSLLKEKELALQANVARIELMQEAMKGAEANRLQTVENIKSNASKSPQVPNIVINMPGNKKAMRTSRDPMTGDFISMAEDIN